VIKNKKLNNCKITVQEIRGFSHDFSMLNKLAYFLEAMILFNK